MKRVQRIGSNTLPYPVAHRLEQDAVVTCPLHTLQRKFDRSNKTVAAGHN